MQYILIINVKMPTIVGILTFISWMNTKICEFKSKEKPSFFSSLAFIRIRLVKQEILDENSKTALSSMGKNAYLYPKNKCLCLSHFILILNSWLLIQSVDNLQTACPKTRTDKTSGLR